MKRNFLLVIFVCFCVFAQAQILKERRVYYLDCSYSMVENQIWDEVRNNLIGAISNVSDETTELVIVPFAFDKKHHDNLTPYIAMATPKGKESLTKTINEMALPNRSTMTYHNDALKDFYNKRVSNDPGRITYMFFMTDGQNEERPGTEEFIPLLRQWGDRFGSMYVYGFYVMLNSLARNEQIEQIVNEQPHLWKVETADVNINLIRLQDKAVFNARNESYFELPIYGNVDNVKFRVRFADNSIYHVAGTSVKNGKLRVNVRYNGDESALPESSNQLLYITADNLSKYDFLITETANVNCLSKKERSLKISIR